MSAPVEFDFKHQKKKVCVCVKGVLSSSLEMPWRPPTQNQLQPETRGNAEDLENTLNLEIGDFHISFV